MCINTLTKSHELRNLYPHLIQLGFKLLILFNTCNFEKFEIIRLELFWNMSAEFTYNARFVFASGSTNTNINMVNRVLTVLAS